MDIIIKSSIPKLREKLLEALQAVLPIAAIVLVLCFSIAPVSPSILLCFLLGAAMIIVGIMFFTLGAEMSMTPMGERVGSMLTRSQNLFLIIGVGCLQLMLDEGKDKDWFASGYIVILGVLTVVGLVLLVAWELTEEHPVVDLSLFRHRNFTVGTICISLGFLFYFAGVVMMPMMLQTRLGYTSMWAGLSLAPIGIFPVFLSPLIGRFAQRIDMRVIVTMSFLVFSAAFYLRTLFSPDVDFAFVLWPQVVQGIGVALFFMPLTSIIISGLDAKDIANASSLSNCTRVLAGSIGSSLATTMWERQEALHHVRLTESINPFNPAAQHGLNQLTQMGLSPEQAKVWVANEITRQGFLLGFNELFWLASIAFIGLAGLVWLSTPINKKIR